MGAEEEEEGYAKSMQFYESIIEFFVCF